MSFYLLARQIPCVVTGIGAVRWADVGLVSQIVLRI